MGTNFYLYHDVCSSCGRGDGPRHIGKSSMGWCFSLRIYPEDGIRDLEDWKPLLLDPKNRIKNETGQFVTPSEMLEIITVRSRPRRVSDKDWEPQLGQPQNVQKQARRQKRKVPLGYESWEEFHERNHSTQGPNGLFRHRLDNFCVAHGAGTWDCMVGEFS